MSRDNKGLDEVKTDKELEKELKSKVEWDQIKRQFSDAEQKIFIEHYLGLVKQFKGDVLKSEYMQITELIKLELLANRCLEEQRSCQSTIEQMEEIIRMEMDQPKDKRDAKRIDKLQNDIIASRSGIVSSKREYLGIIERKDRLFNDLKATRSQRHKLREDSKTSFFDWVRLMIESKEKRRQVGIDMEKMRLAVEKERKRLSENHEYADKEIDRPILDSDSVMGDDMEPIEQHIE